MNKIWVLLILVVIGISCQVKKDDRGKLPPGYNEPLKGVWLTNVASEALYTRENIVKAVEDCDDLGLNTIFVVTWNKAMTMYPSQIMKDFTGVEIDPVLDPDKKGRDPLQELIDEAHKRNIKVFAWFEFGFSSSYNKNGGKIAELKPEWMALTNKGELCTKNNFDWMNALNPEVQNFMTSLVLEVVKNYDVDGIQGDDRLPAMPSSGGYNPETIEWYKKEHLGQAPSDNYKDFEWVNWRSEKLNEYLKSLYNEVKAIKPQCIVSMAPSVYPWSKEEYLQDWPTWINHGYVDMLCPQIYRKDSARYEQTLKATLDYILPEKRHLFFPGVLIQVNNQQPSKEFFNYMIECNRKADVDGEVYFFYEGLHTFENELKAIYKAN
ncbi:MAG: family 10 glycosylhydrolase [Carboxylicivirga sp.]|jgi:uncharacterized lipoprotein YddW (UPF0748 family)|nr:family 10 glycosylhydrolase [Carboxylicivirga sp.]